MKKTVLNIILLLLSICLIGFACSDKKEAEKGVIEEMTDNAAKKVADKLMAPVERARDAQNLSEDHMNDIEDALKE
jgi:hypothetical protein